jgi:hypothetical protein
VLRDKVVPVLNWVRVLGDGYIDPRCLTSALVGGKWSASRSFLLTPGERIRDTHWIEGLVGCRFGLKYMEKLRFFSIPGFEVRPLTRPARCHSYYRLAPAAPNGKGRAENA